MSAPPLPWEILVRKCYGKRRFSTRKDARDGASRTRRNKGVTVWPYYCAICRAYHLTSQSPKTQKELRHRRSGRGE